MIKNYSSTVPIEKTIQQIESLLISGGACNTERIYVDKQLIAIRFGVTEPTTGKVFKVNLDADAEALYQALKNKVKRPRAGTLEKIREQAHRTAWRLNLDRLQIEMTRIELGQVHFLRVFLPDLWDGRKTFFDRIQDGGFKLLTAGEPVEASR